MAHEVPWRFIKGLSSKKEREKAGMTVAEGPPSVFSALESGVQVEYLVMSESFSNSPGGLSVGRIVESGRKPREVFKVPDALFERMSDTRTPQGVLCVVPVPMRFPEGSLRSPWEEPLEVIGVDIQDPGNAGTLIRAASAVGASRVVFAGKSVDPFSPKCIRSSAGTIFAVPVTTAGQQLDPARFVADLAKAGLSIYKTVPSGGIFPWEADFTLPCAIVVGNEAQGLQQEVVDGPGRGISIPMPGGTESLNVAVASGMVLYEALRQRIGRA
jgi:TrmH family RNA methyltransferase